MKNVFRKSICLLLALALTGLTACQSGGKETVPETTAAPATQQETAAPETSAAQAPETSSEPAAEWIDYAASVTLDMNSETVKEPVTVKTFVDGDTTHFHVSGQVAEDGVLKGRYLAVNTPESTGKVEPFGKTASIFTREKLENASAILIESDDGKWNLDSTGGRYLVWVWYKPSENEPYRNLNIELLQYGLANASNSGQNRYGETCIMAISQARREKLNLYSGEKDPNFYYGEAHELTLREIRLHPKEYEGEKVAFEGVLTRQANNTVYAEEYDPDLDLYFGLSVYMGTGLSGSALRIMKVGNRVRVVGTLQYYEAGGTWQVSGLTYDEMDRNHPGNVQLISDGHDPAYRLTEAKVLTEGTVDVDGEAYAYSYLTLDSTAALNDLTVKSFYATESEGSSNGALTLYCEAADGTSLQLRTLALKHEDGSLITGDEFVGKTVDVKGLVSVFDGTVQIKILKAEDIQIHPD